MNEIEQGVPLNEQGEGLLEPSPQADTEQALNSITPLMEIGATDGDDSEDTVPDDAKNYVEAPFNYNHDSHEHVPLNSGTFSYTVTDLALPGKNGLDLVIKRRYDTTQASSYEFARGFRKTTTLQRKRKKPYLGIGWCLDLPWIEHSQSGLYPRFLHLEDGRKLSVKKLSSGVYLRHYKLKDMQLTQEGYHVYVHGEQVNYAYRLDLKDGKSHYFDRDGLIVATIDRFGNQLRYILSEHGAVLIDTYGRKLTLSYAEIPTYEGGKDYSGTPPITVIPIEVPDPERPVAKSWEYTGTYTWNGLPSNHTITYRCENGYLVHSTDQCGQWTGYEYCEMPVHGNLHPKYDHYGKRKSSIQPFPL